MTDWNDFYQAAAGASAALLGLIFVGIYINLKDILSKPGLDRRASIALTLLLGVVVISLLQLMPGFSTAAKGMILLWPGALFWILASYFDRHIYRSKARDYKLLYLFNLVLNQLSLLPYIIGGVYVYNGNEKGFYLAAGGMLLSVIKSVLDAWVLLVEINR